MSTLSNRFLSQLEDVERPSEKEEKEVYETNRFLKQIERQKPEEKLPTSARLLEKGRQTLTETAKRSPRYLMQGAIGTALGRLLLSPAGVPSILGSVATPGAIEGVLREEEEFQRDLPSRLKEALNLPEYKPEVARQTAKQLYEKISGSRGIIDRATQLPFELAGIDTEPQTPGEEATRFTSEIISGLGGPQTFTQILFDELPKSIKTFFKNKPQELLRKLIGQEALPESVYETAEKIFQEFEAQQAPKSLEGRIRAGGEPLEVRPPTEPRPQAPTTSPEGKLTENTGKQISPHKFETEFGGGQTQFQAVQEVAKEGKKVLNEAYDAADAAYQATNDVYPSLVNRLEEARDKILGGRDTKLLNSAEKNVVDSINNLLESLVTPTGEFIEQPVSVLLKTAKSWSSKLSHEEIFGDVKRFLSKLIPSLNEAGLAAVERKGLNPDLLRKADRQYAEWAEKFANDEIAPYLQKTIRNPEALFRKSVSDEGTFRAVKNALEGTAYEDVISGATAREIAESRLNKFIKDPKQIGSSEYEKEIRNLKPLIGDAETERVDKFLRETQKKRFPSERKPLVATLKPAEKKVSKFLEMKPEDLIKMGKTRSGLKELKKELEKSPKGKMLYNQFKRQRIRDILTENKLTRKMKGKELYNVLNKRENYEILSELIGEEETSGAFYAAKELAEKKINTEALKKIGATTLTIKFYKLLVDLLP